MKRVDVFSSIEIDRPLAEVAAFSADPDNATRWTAKIRSVEWQTPRPLQTGSRVTFTARFLGRSLRYTHEVVEFVPHVQLVMRTAQGLFPMETTYAWEAVARDRTRMEVRNRGVATGFAALTAGSLIKAMRRANIADLDRLKALLEASPPR